MSAQKQPEVLPFVIGTAGHIDHGKTALIKALTGIDADRLPEEKKRGMTIDIGFAYLDLPQGLRVGIVDVPGHEALIKNMLVGATGFGFVLLLVAADDGVMPQTREHLYCLHSLGVREGIGVITKVDTVEEGRVQEVEEEFRSLLKETTLEDMPIMSVSSITGKGIDGLKKTIASKVAEILPAERGANFRLPVDRIFTVDGFGTVVTGTVLSGTIVKGEEVSIFPDRLKTRIRNIESHFEEVETVSSGQRAAVNLAGVERSDLERGSMVVKGPLKGFTAADCRVELVNPLPRALKNGSRVKIFHATNELEGKIIIKDKEIGEGFKGYVHLSFDKPVVIFHKDRFILRDMASPRVIGGGEVILPHRKPLRRKALSEPPADTPSLVAYLLLKNPVLTVTELKERLNLATKEIEALIPAGSIRKGDYLFHERNWESLKRKVLKIIEEHHQKDSISKGLGQEEIGMNVKIPHEPLKALLESLQNEKKVDREGSLYRSPQHMIKFEGEKGRIRDATIQMLKDQVLREGRVFEALSNYGQDAKEVWRGLITTGDIARLGEDFYTSSDNVDKAIAIVKKLYEDQGSVTVKDFKSVLGVGRRDAILFLEHLDMKGLTIRDGDARKLRSV